MRSRSPYERALRDLQTTVVQLRDHGLVPTPVNLIIWYCHVSGGYPELSRQLESLSQTVGIDEDELVRLGRHVFGVSPELIERVGRETNDVMTRSIGEISDAADREGAFLERLQEFGQTLNAGALPLKEKQLVSELIGKVGTLEQQTILLERRLRDSSSIITALRDELEVATREANLDGLTRIANRRTFEQELARRAACVDGEHTRAAVLLIDVDHLDRFNQEHGRAIGDQLLKVLAKTLVGCVKGSDLVARSDGGAFAVLLPDTRLFDALKVAGRIRKAVAGNRITLKSGHRDLGAVTVTVGVAEAARGEPASHILGRAEKALMRGKAAGRNLVMASSDSATSEFPHLETPAA